MSGDIVTDVDEQDRSLGVGVLAEVFRDDSRSEPAIGHLAELGLSNSSEDVQNAVRAALTHVSFLNENQRHLPHMSRAVLEALSGLGLAFVRRLAAIEIFQRNLTVSLNEMSKYVGHSAFLIDVWAADQSWLRESCLLGRSLSVESLPPRVLGTIYQQVVGALCVANEVKLARALVSPLLSETWHQQSTSVADPKTLLQESLSRVVVTYTYQREGPDHDASFRATASVSGDGRIGTGVGRSKKQASREAALDFLNKHLQHVVASHTTAAQPRVHSPVQMQGYRRHSDVVLKVQRAFALPRSSLPLISQALLHSSWTYEHRQEMARHYQEDNQILAFLGSQIVVYEDYLGAVRQVVLAPPDEFTFHHLDNTAYDYAFRTAGLENGLLLGAGQASNGISVEMGSNAFQAVMAAVAAAKQFPDSISDSWPSSWPTLWLASTRGPDSTTLLQRAASAMRLDIEHRLERSGPDHDGRYQDTVVFSSETLEAQAHMSGPTTQGSKARAKHAASTAALTLLDRLSIPGFSSELSPGEPVNAELASFFIRQQFAVLSESPVSVSRWLAARLFGSHLATEPRHLLHWAADVDDVLGRQPLPPVREDRLEEFFRTALELGSGPRHHQIQSHLASTLDAIGRVGAPSGISDQNILDIVILCDVYRCMGSDDPAMLLPDLVDGWRLLYRDKAFVPAQMPEISLNHRERSILDAALSSIISATSDCRVELIADEALYLRFTSRAQDLIEGDDWKSQFSLWADVCRTAELAPIDNGIDVKISAIKTPARPGKVTMGVIHSLIPRSESLHAAVADLLHDLKNQLVAARQAHTQRHETETGRLEQQLAALRHLESAKTIAVRLRSITSVIDSVDGEDTFVELGAFLRDYLRAVLAWLPANISLSIPMAGQPTAVLISHHALTATLDNLMKNAAEALRNGGSIKLSWSADADQAVIDLQDDGPGLPDDVIQALTLGKRIRSAKPGGSGIGLLAVRSLLRQVGGSLSALPGSSGSTLRLTLPISPSETTG